MRPGRLAILLLMAIAAASPGCGRPESPAPAPASAAKALAVAEGLERAHKAKSAFAAYHQIIRHFPGTPEAARAADRIRQGQSAALKRAATRKRS